jgi:alpha-1,2-mannosyltransferase
MDFAAFYAGAWAIRLGVSPYGWSPEFLDGLQIETSLPPYPPIPYNPPVWLWLLQPLTFFSFPVATVVWLLLVLVFLGWSAIALAQLAGYQGWKHKGVAFLVVLTFGPTFLDLTLGQNSFFLLATVLVIGQTLRTTAKGFRLSAALAGGLAVGAKLFPLIWLGALALLCRWRLFVSAILVVLLAMSLPFLLTPAASQSYWLDVLPQRVRSTSEQVGIDDQSLVAWLDRLGRPHTFRIPGLSVTRQHTVTWSPPWSVDPHVIRLGGYFLVALLALIPIMVLLRTGHAEAEGAFYLWVLYGLIVFPHMERYNHVLLLPAMAWLWARSETFAQRGRNLVILAYFLAGLSRLNHLWAILLPAPWGPLASGFGLYAVLVLGGGMATFLRPSKLSSMAREGQP